MLMMTYGVEKECVIVSKIFIRFLEEAREIVSACKYQVCAKKQMRHTTSSVWNKVIENKVDVCNTILE